MDELPETMARSLLSSASDVAVVVDTGGKLVWWNERLNEVTGYGDEELIGRNSTELVPESQREAALEAIATVDEMTATETRQFDLVAADGERIPYEFNGTSFETDGEPVGVGIVGRDISDRLGRERELRRQRDELETLNRVNETAYEIVRALVDASTREEIEEIVCDRLGATDLYRAVWIARSGSRPIRPDASNGIDETILDTFQTLDDHDRKRTTAIALESGTMQIIERTQESDLPQETREIAERYGITASAAIPIVHRDTIFGVLVVYSGRSEAFSDREQAALRRLGEIIGYAISAVHSEQLLLSNAVAELEIRVGGPQTFLAAVSAEADGVCRHERTTPIGDDQYRHYIRVPDLAPERVEEIVEATPRVISCEHAASDGDEGIFSIRTADSFVQRLLDVGAFPTTIKADDGESTVTAEIPPETDPRTVLEAIGEQYEAELIAKRERKRSIQLGEEYRDSVVDRLTERQAEVLQNAFVGGYFEWPRDVTAEELADELDLSSPTLHYHLRGAERALAEAYFEYSR